eukprot:m.125091 g.125091  ORF g.125091 m.125091 type:complete len:397 (-) comp16645_c0_seq2:278-1468(-)
MALSARAIAVVKSTAAVVAPHAEAITRNFYPRMLGAHPELYKFFNKNNQRTNRQPKALAEAVVAYASNIDNLGVLGAAVELMATKHCGLQVLPEHYQIVHDNLMESVAEVLGDAVTPEIGQGWSEAVMGLAGILIDAEETLYKAAESRSGGWRGWREFELVDKIDMTKDVSTFSFAPKDGNVPATGFDFTAGQYLTVDSGLKDEEGDWVAPRHYTITSQAGDPVIQCTVKRLEGGTVSSHLHSMTSGDVINMSPPFGCFTSPAELENPMFLSAGIGITPMVAFARQRHALRAAPLANDTFMHLDREPQETPQALVSYIEESGATLAPIHDHGRIMSAEDLSKAISSATNVEGRTAYLCGPSEFMAKAATVLQDLGAAKVLYEDFGPRTQAVVKGTM